MFEDQSLGKESSMIWPEPLGTRKVNIERWALRSSQDLVTIIKNLVKLVRTLREAGAMVVTICPMPRHFTPVVGGRIILGKISPMRSTS